MAASVRIDDEAFSDERYGVLAALAGLADADHARGKMLRLWRQCTALGAYVLPEAVVVSVLGPEGPSALVESGLGAAVSAGIRIRGTKGRIEWLQKLRKNAVKGGRAKSAKRQPLGSPESAKTPAKSLPPPCPPTPVPTPTPSGEEELPLPRVRAMPPPSSTEQGEELATSPEPPEPAPEPVPIADRQDLRRRSWARLGEIRAQVARELGVTARPLAVFDPGERELGERIREAGDRAEADVEHVLAVLADEARSKGTVEWLTGGVFRPDRWVRALGMTREDATRTRSPARASWHQPAADEAPRKLRRL